MYSTACVAYRCSHCSCTNILVLLSVCSTQGTGLLDLNENFQSSYRPCSSWEEQTLQIPGVVCSVGSGWGGFVPAVPAAPLALERALLAEVLLFLHSSAPCIRQEADVNSAHFWLDSHYTSGCSWEVVPAFHVLPDLEIQSSQWLGLFMWHFWHCCNDLGTWKSVSVLSCDRLWYWQSSCAGKDREGVYIQPNVYFQ